MGNKLFKHITKYMKFHNSFEERRNCQKKNCAGDPGHNTYQKVITALHMMTYTISSDIVDEHLAVDESQTIKCVKRGFVVAIVEVFGLEYLRAPNVQDMAKLLAINARGFLGMLGFIDCML
jgi:hypothetical protein